MVHIKLMLLQFILFSIAGWFLEVVYRSLSNRRFINPGFLTGPYLPIYGAGAVIITSIAYMFPQQPLVYKFFIYMFSLSALEYIAGLILLSVTGKRYWDYTDEFCNIQGHVSLPFSIIWGILALAFEYALLPLYNYGVSLLSSITINAIIGAASLVMLTDFLITHNMLHYLLPQWSKKYTRFHVPLLKLQSDILLQLRSITQITFLSGKKFTMQKVFLQNKIMALLKKRYTAFIEKAHNSISKPFN